MEKQKENEGSTSKPKKTPQKKVRDSSDEPFQTSSSSSSSLRTRLQKFDISLPEDLQKGRTSNEPVEETALDYFKNLPPSGIHLTESTTDIVRQLVQFNAEPTFGGKRNPKLHPTVKKFPTVEEDLTKEEAELSNSSSFAGSKVSEDSNYEEVERKGKEASRKERIERKSKVTLDKERIEKKQKEGEK